MSASVGAGGRKKVTLRCSDGQEFEVDEEVAVKSRTIRHMIEDGYAADTIPLANVTGKILAKVIEYCQKHARVEAGHAAFLRSFTDGTGNEDRVIDEELRAWDADFVKVEQNTLFDILLAANYLNINSLLDLTCQTVANMIKGKTVKDIRDAFHIVNDYTPEEEEGVRRENQWAFE